MRSQYYYEPPRSNWLDSLRFLIEPPTAYISFLGGIGLALLLLAFPEVSRYGANILVLLIAFPIHELSHALVADRLGDATPRLNGRITLNPFAQLNLIGSILMIIVGLGWAYVPINPRYLRPNPRTGHMLVAIAGPISNLILAVLCAGLWHLLTLSLQSLGLLSVVEYLYRLLFWFCFINLALFFFNLIPIFPLDGFAVLKGLLPYELAYQLERVQQYGMLIFLGLFFIAPLMGLPILDKLIFGPANAIAQFLFWGV
jgi:Zn-dependent protease